MGSHIKPCCAADALRRIRQIPINGIPNGITMLDESIAETCTPQTSKGVQLHSPEYRVRICSCIGRRMQEIFSKIVM
jgi:hypothetical protein